MNNNSLMSRTNQQHHLHDDFDHQQQHSYHQREHSPRSATNTAAAGHDGSNNWHDIFLEVTCDQFQQQSMQMDPVQCFHIAFNEMCKLRPDVCRTSHLGHVLELPVSDEGKKIFLSKYFDLHASPKASEQSKDPFNNMIKNLKNRGYKKKGHMLLLPYHQIKKCIDMTVAQNSMKTDDGRGWCIENKQDAMIKFQNDFNRNWTDKNEFKCRYKIKFQEIESVLRDFFYYEIIEKDNMRIYLETEETAPTAIHSEDLIWMMDSTPNSTTIANNNNSVEHYIHVVSICARLASKKANDCAWLQEQMINAIISNIRSNTDNHQEIS